MFFKILEVLKIMKGYLIKMYCAIKYIFSSLITSYKNYCRLVDNFYYKINMIKNWTLSTTLIQFFYKIIKFIKKLIYQKIERLFWFLLEDNPEDTPKYLFFRDLTAMLALVVIFLKYWFEAIFRALCVQVDKLEENYSLAEASRAFYGVLILFYIFYKFIVYILVRYKSVFNFLLKYRFNSFWFFITSLYFIYIIIGLIYSVNLIFLTGFGECISYNISFLMHVYLWVAETVFEILKIIFKAFIAILYELLKLLKKIFINGQITPLKP